MNSQQCLFDSDKFLERLFGDEVLANRVGWCVLSDLDRNLEGLDQAIDAKDKSQILFYLHNLKGVAANTHCEALFELARDLEGEAMNSQDIGECVAKLGGLFTLTRDSMESLRNYLDQSNSCNREQE